MNRLRNVANRLLRWSAGGLSLLSALVILLLGGYWIGWQTQPKVEWFAGTTRPSSSSTPSSPDQRIRESTATSIGEAVRVPASAKGAPVEDRVLRLARLLGTARDTRTTSAGVTAEIAGMSLVEVWEGLNQLHHAPDTRVVADLRARLLLRWATEDPASAFDYWRGSVGSLRWPDSLNHTLFDRWAKVDPMSALTGWQTLVAEKRIPEHEQGYPLRRIFARMAAQDLGLAAQQARQFEGPHLSEALRGLADPAFEIEYREKLLAELSSWPPDRAKDELLSSVVANWAETGEFGDAMAWLEASGVDESTRFEIVEEIGMRRFHEHYHEGADWLLAQAQTPEQRSRVLANLINNWMQYDMMEAGEWLVAQGLDESASRAMGIYARKLTTDFPEAALVWVLSIPDGIRRQEAMAHVEERIRERHPDRAEELLQAWQQ